MLFKRELWPRLADGSVTVAIRRQKRPTVRAGGTLQTPGGLLAIDAVEAVETDQVTDQDARDAGYSDRQGVLADVRAEGTLYRIRFHRLGEDPRVELRRRASLGTEEVTGLARNLGRLGWALPVLRLIEANPGVVSTELAARLAMERLPFKQKVRRLKTLGLTESLKVGYRLSPRGEAFLERLQSAGSPDTGAPESGV